MQQIFPLLDWNDVNLSMTQLLTSNNICVCVCVCVNAQSWGTTYRVPGEYLHSECINNFVHMASPKIIFDQSLETYTVKDDQRFVCMCLIIIMYSFDSFFFSTCPVFMFTELGIDFSHIFSLMPDSSGFYIYLYLYLP